MIMMIVQQLNHDMSNNVIMDANQYEYIAGY